MKATKKLARILVLPILLFFGTSAFAGNAAKTNKGNECTCAHCCCKDCKASCGEKCDGKCCSAKTAKAGTCSKNNAKSAHGSCCKAGTKTAVAGANEKTCCIAGNGAACSKDKCDGCKDCKDKGCGSCCGEKK